MNLLLDTHVLLWWLADDRRLGAEAREAIGDPGHHVFVSAASIWEIVIKQAVGKLSVPADFTSALAGEPLLSLPITAAHALAVKALPPIHQDPFDRMLVAQCLVEALTLVTADGRLKQYPVDTLGT